MIRPLLSAVAFLTRIPVPAFVHSSDDSLRRSVVWFPVVGLLLGLIYAGVARLAVQQFPATVVAVLLLIIDTWLTGALHLDGLADMADGFGGGRRREDVLRIMRDHAIGSYGGAALILLLLLKASCLTELIVRQHGLEVIVVAPALARWSILLLSRIQPYARRDADKSAPGLGRLCEGVTRLDLVMGSVFCSALSFLFGLKVTLVCWLAVAAVTFSIAHVCSRRIHGITGDTLGANVVAAEALQFAVALLVLPR